MCSCYLYCVVDCNDITGIMENGINGSKIKVYDMDGFYALYSCLDTDYVNRSLNNLKIHNQISLLMMNRCTVLPLRFGTVAKSFNNMGEMLHKFNKEGLLDYLFICLKGKIEVGIKVFGRMKQATSSTEGLLPAIDRLNAVKRTSESLHYLMKMVSSVYEARDRSESLEKLSDSIFTVLSPLICDKRITYGEKDGLLVNGSYLIYKENFQDFKSLFFNIKKQYPHYSLIFSGPWPPYSFIKMRKECEISG